MVPLLGDAVAEDVGAAAVDHRQLAMVALVEPADRAQAERVVEDDSAAGVAHALDQPPLDVRGAQRVEQHPHLDAVAGTRGEGLGDAVADRPAPPHVRLEMDGLASARDLLEQRGEERLVLQDLEPVAVRLLAPGQRFDGGQPAGKRVDLVRIDPGRTLAARGPEHDREQDHQQPSTEDQQEPPEGQLQHDQA